jgi:uncharacterized membrane protein YphA (DoxX/SURF4 family)
MRGISNKYILHSLRILIGGIFIISSIFKLIGVDAFEIYIFSLEWVGLPAASILARIIISSEFLLGFLLVTNIRFDLIKKITFGVLLLFSAFLIIQITRGETENCHCFGEIIQLSPMASLIKNGIIIILLLLSFKNTGFNLRYASNIILFTGSFAIAFPMIISPPDFMIQWTPVSGDVLAIAGKRMNNDSILNAAGANNDKKIICFLSLQCDYCIQSATKISIIAKKHDLNEEVLFVFMGNENDLPAFWEESMSTKFKYTFMPMRPFFQIAGPAVPSIYLSENGNFKQQFNYRNINEQTIATFFNHK